MTTIGQNTGQGGSPNNDIVQTHDAAGQLEDDDHARNDLDDGNYEDNSNGDHEGRQLSRGKRKPPDDDQYDTDDDSWTERLRPRKMSPRK